MNVKSRYEFCRILLAIEFLLLICSCSVVIEEPTFAMCDKENVIIVIIPNQNKYEFITFHFDKANLGDYKIEQLSARANKFVNDGGNIRYAVDNNGLKKFMTNGKPYKKFEFVDSQVARDIYKNLQSAMETFQTQYNLDYSEQLQLVQKILQHFNGVSTL